MKFKIDENLPIEVAELFRQSGYDAMTVLEQDFGGRADADLASICQKEMRAFVTLDTDFARRKNILPAIRKFPSKMDCVFENSSGILEIK